MCLVKFLGKVIHCRNSLCKFFAHCPSQTFKTQLLFKSISTDPATTSRWSFSVCLSVVIYDYGDEWPRTLEEENRKVLTIKSPNLWCPLNLRPSSLSTLLQLNLFSSRLPVSLSIYSERVRVLCLSRLQCWQKNFKTTTNFFFFLSSSAPCNGIIHKVNYFQRRTDEFPPPQIG